MSKKYNTLITNIIETDTDRVKLCKSYVDYYIYCDPVGFVISMTCRDNAACYNYKKNKDKNIVQTVVRRPIDYNTDRINIVIITTDRCDLGFTNYKTVVDWIKSSGSLYMTKYGILRERLLDVGKQYGFNIKYETNDDK